MKKNLLFIIAAVSLSISAYANVGFNQLKNELKIGDRYYGENCEVEFSYDPVENWLGATLTIPTLNQVYVYFDSNHNQFEVVGNQRIEGKVFLKAQSGQARPVYDELTLTFDKRTKKLIEVTGSRRSAFVPNKISCSNLKESNGGGVQAAAPRAYSTH